MREVLKRALVILVEIPVYYLILRLIFRKSVMFTYNFYIKINGSISCCPI